MPDIFKSQKNQTSVSPTATSIGSPVTAMSTFIVRPNGIRFETQAEEEEIILFLRQDFIVNVGWIIISIILLIAPILIVPALASAQFIPPDVPPGYFLVMPLIWYLGVFGYMLVNFIHWYYNVYIVTNQRIVDIDWENLLYKHFSSTKLDKVQDVSFKQGGFLGLIFDFGDVIIQTAGTEQNFEFDEVPKPDVVVEQINRYIKEGKI